MTREQVIKSMCMTFRHDYGLLGQFEQESLFKQMAQIFDNDIKGELMMQCEVDEFEEISGELEDQIISLEQEIEQFKNRTCESCKFYVKTTQKNHICNLNHDIWHLDRGCEQWEAKIEKPTNS